MCPGLYIVWSIGYSNKHTIVFMHSDFCVYISTFSHIFPPLLFYYLSLSLSLSILLTFSLVFSKQQLKLLSTNENSFWSKNTYCTQEVQWNLHSWMWMVFFWDMHILGVSIVDLTILRCRFIVFVKNIIPLSRKEKILKVSVMDRIK